MESEEFKVCSSCGERKLAEINFYKIGKRAQGYRGQCKKCYNKNVTNWQTDNPEKMTKYRKTSHSRHREKRNEASRVYGKTRRDRSKKSTYNKNYWDENKDNLKIKNAKYRETHKEEIQEQKRSYSIEHKEEIATANKEWRDNNREENLQKKRDYGKNNPEVSFRHTQKRRAQKRQTQIEVITRQQWEFMKSIYGYRCIYCGKKTVALQQDHIIPLARGGTHTIENIVPACGPCNAKKGVKPAPIIQIVLPDLIRGMGA